MNAHNPTQTLALLELRKYNNSNLQPLPLANFSHDTGIFELADPFPANLRIIEEIDLNFPEHSCNQDIPIPRSGDVLLEMVVCIDQLPDEKGIENSEDAYSIELYQYSNNPLRIDCVHGKLGQVMNVVPFPKAGLNLLPCDCIYVAIRTSSGQQRCCTGRLFLIYGVLPTDFRRTLATYTIPNTDKGVGYVHRNGNVLRTRKKSGSLFANPCVILPD